MKLGPYLLINLLIVGGGIFIYDSFKGDPPAPASSELTHLTADAPDDPIGRPAPAPIQLDGGANDMLLRENAKRINALESALRALRQSVRDGAASPGGTGSDPVAPLAERDLVDEDDPVFDDRTLATISSYLDEINRRKNEERQRTRIATELERKGIKLNERQRESVVAESLAYQAKARDLLRKQWDRTEAGREARKRAFEGLQEDYASTIKSLVSEEQADQILESRLGRGMGFFGNMAGGGRQGRGRIPPGKR